MSTISVLDATGTPTPIEKPLAPGQALMANSRPVVIASDQPAVPVAGTFFQATQPVSLASLPALIASAAIIGKVGIDQTTPGTTNLVAAGQSGAWNITNVSGTISLPTGAATSANQTTLNTAIGSSADAAVGNGASGSIAAYLRSIKDAATDTTTVSPVKIDQTTPGTTNQVSATVRNPSYETVAASQTDQVMGASGAAGDILSAVLIIPATTSPGAVSIKDGVGSAITIFTGGASSVSTLIPFAVPLGIVAGTAWKITTGANVSAIGIGKFS